LEIQEQAKSIFFCEGKGTPCGIEEGQIFASLLTIVPNRVVDLHKLLIASLSRSLLCAVILFYHFNPTNYLFNEREKQNMLCFGWTRQENNVEK